MLRNLLICGLVAGLCGGVFAFAFASVAGEPAVDAAIAFEEKNAAAEQTKAEATGGHTHAADEEEAVSRGEQKGFGLLTASLIYGLAIGGLFSLVFAFAYGRVGKASPRTTAYWLAGLAFAVFFLIPFLKYPSTPPAVGDPETIGERTLLYVTMVAISVLAAIAAARLRPALVERLGGHGATLVALASYLVVVVVAGLALPTVAEVPNGFPANALWEFRIGSLGTQAVLWVGIGLVFATTAQRVMTGQTMLPRRSRAAQSPT